MIAGKFWQQHELNWWEGILIDAIKHPNTQETFLAETSELRKHYLVVIDSTFIYAITHLVKKHLQHVPDMEDFCKERKVFQCFLEQDCKDLILKMLEKAVLYGWIGDLARKSVLEKLSICIPYMDNIKGDFYASPVVIASSDIGPNWRKVCQHIGISKD